MSSKVNPIFKELWELDENRIPHAASIDKISKTEGGFVLSTEKELLQATKDDKLFKKLVIPEKKKKSYQMITQLFDNYEPQEHIGEVLTAKEIKEINDYLDFAIPTKVMRRAQEYCGYKGKDAAWKDWLKNIWFSFFSTNKGKDLSAFEHVFVGEESRGNIVGGYHFWYKLYHDENDGDDEIDIQGLYDRESLPESITVRSTTEVDPKHVIVKQKGGFLIGPSGEGLMALYTAAAYAKLHNHKLDGVFGNKLFSQQVFFVAATNGKQCFRTCYSVYVGPAPADSKPSSNTPPPKPGPQEEKPSVSGSVAIIGILPNPVGEDKGNEKIKLKSKSGKFTLDVVKGFQIAVNTGAAQSLKNANFSIKNDEVTITLPEDIVLPNTGATVRIFDKNGEVLDTERYSSSKKQGVWFNFPVD